MRLSLRLWAILSISSVLILLAAAAFLYGGQLTGFGQSAPHVSWIGVGISVFVFVGSQIIFILPLVKVPTVTPKGKCLFRSILIAGIFAAILTTMFGMLVMSIVQMSMTMPSDDGWGILSLLFVGWWTVDWDDFFDPTQSEMYILYIEFGLLLLSWIFWTWLLWVFVQRRHKDPSTLVRITGWLFSGTIVELLLAVPLMLIVRRRTDCYCATGSFGTLILSIMGCLWLCGPGIVIALIWRKRPWIKDHCFHCGYPRKVAGVSNCSECGTQLNQK